MTGCCRGRGSPNTCFSPRDEGAFARAAVAGAGRAPGSSCWGFPGSGLTWDGAAWPLPWPAGCKTQLYATTLTHAAAGLPGHPAARPCALPGWERAGGVIRLSRGAAQCLAPAGPSQAPLKMQPKPLTCRSHLCSEFCLFSPQRRFLPAPLQLGQSQRVGQRWVGAAGAAAMLHPSMGSIAPILSGTAPSLPASPKCDPGPRAHTRALAGAAQNARNVLW